MTNSISGYRKKQQEVSTNEVLSALFNEREGILAQARILVGTENLTCETFLSILVHEGWGHEYSKQIIDLQRRLTMLFDVERYLVEDCGEKQ